MSHSLFQHFPLICMRKIIQNSLDAELGSRLGYLLCNYESHHNCEFIVTLTVHLKSISFHCINHHFLALVTNLTKREKATAGSDWYDLPRTDLTPELKRDLQLLQLRSVLDPHRHYKKDTGRKNQIPEFSQVGTIIEGPTEFFSSRLTNKERKRTFVEEILAGEKANSRFKSKYNVIQAAKTSGKKNHYKAIKAQRAHRSSKGWTGDLSMISKIHHYSNDDSGAEPMEILTLDSVLPFTKAATSRLATQS